MSFKEEFDKLSKVIWMNAVEHGFWKAEYGKNNDGEKIALIHSEISEALEALRQNNPSSNKIIEFSSLEEELADAMIRIMDFAFASNLDLAGAILAKIEYNKGREFLHGKAF
tara:strand:+ start:879 stop:1214 length:336 start_codon:yes stop_codon:yes gene_type:complete